MTNIKNTLVILKDYGYDNDYNSYFIISQDHLKYNDVVALKGDDIQRYLYLSDADYNLALSKAFDASITDLVGYDNYVAKFNLKNQSKLADLVDSSIKSQSKDIASGKITVKDLIDINTAKLPSAKSLNDWAKDMAKMNTDSKPLNPIITMLDNLGLPIKSLDTANIDCAKDNICSVISINFYD